MKNMKALTMALLGLTIVSALGGEIHDAVATGNLAAVKNLIAANPGAVNEKNENQITPLHVAVRIDNLEMARFLILSGAEAGAKTSQGITPLHDAAGRGNLGMAKLLVEANPKGVNETNRMGMTALMFAVGTNAAVAALLITNKADVNYQTLEKVTALHFAALKGRVDCVKLLLENGADVNARDDRGNNAAHFAMSKFSNPHKEILEALIAHKIDLNAKGLDKKSPLDCAKGLRKPELVEFLKQHGAR